MHFVNGTQHLPAIITDPAFVPADSEEPQQALTVFPVGEAPFTTVASFDESATPASWHWPEYVP